MNFSAGFSGLSGKSLIWWFKGFSGFLCFSFFWPGHSWTVFFPQQLLSESMFRCVETIACLDPFALVAFHMKCSSSSFSDKGRALGSSQASIPDGHAQNTPLLKAATEKKLVEVSAHMAVSVKSI